MRAIPVTLPAPARDGDQDDFTTGFAAHLPCHVISVRLRHADIQQGDVRLHCKQGVESFAPVIDDGYFMSFHSQERCVAFRSIARSGSRKHGKAIQLPHGLGDVACSSACQCFELII